MSTKMTPRMMPAVTNSFWERLFGRASDTITGGRPDMNTMIWSMALAIALALASAPSQAQGKLPRSVAEQRAKAETVRALAELPAPAGQRSGRRLPCAFGQYRGGVRRLRSDRDSALCVAGGLHWHPDGRISGAFRAGKAAISSAIRPGGLLKCVAMTDQNKTEIAFVADIRKRRQGKPGLGQPAL